MIRNELKAGLTTVQSDSGDAGRYLGMRLQALVIHKAVRQRGKKEVEKKATERDDEPQAKKLARPMIGRRGRNARESEYAII